MNPLKVFFAAICLAALVVSVVIPAPAATPTSDSETYMSVHGRAGENSMIAFTDLESSSTSSIGGDIGVIGHTVTLSPTGRPSGCHPSYCERGTSYCWFWGGITGWDSSFNPVPGMTRTSVGTCATSEAVKTVESGMGILGKERKE